MKTAEEWKTDIYGSMTSDGCPTDETISVIKQIQLDAWKQGMTDAGVIAMRNEASLSIRQAIYTYRDNTNKLP